MRDRSRKTRKISWLTLAGRLALAGLVGLALTAPAWAQDEDDEEEAEAENGEDADGDPFAGLYGKRSFYLTATGNLMIPTEKSQLERDANDRLVGLFGPPVSTNVDNSWGLSAQAGYRAHERLAIETQFEWLNTIELDHKIGAGLEQKTEITLWSLTGNLKGYLMGTGRFQPYLLAGAGWGQSRTNTAGSSANDRDDGVVFRFGGGMELYAKPDIALTLQASYVIPEGGIDDLNYVSLGAGLMLRFFPGGY